MIIIFYTRKQALINLTIFKGTNYVFFPASKLSRNWYRMVFMDIYNGTQKINAQNKKKNTVYENY